MHFVILRLYYSNKCTMSKHIKKIKNVTPACFGTTRTIFGERN